MDAEPWLAAGVVEELGCIPVLAGGQVGPAIVVVIADRCTPAFAVDPDATLRARHGLEFAVTISFQ
jgi:hypothetical protein